MKRRDSQSSIAQEELSMLTADNKEDIASQGKNTPPRSNYMASRPILDSGYGPYGTLEQFYEPEIGTVSTTYPSQNILPLPFVPHFDQPGIYHDP